MKRSWGNLFGFSAARSSRSSRKRLLIERLEDRRLLTFYPTTTYAVEASSPITVDGSLGESAWAKAYNVRTFYVYNSGGQHAADLTAKILWDDNYLYFGASMTDPYVDSAGAGHDGALYKGDNVELFLKPAAGDTPYYEFEFSPNGDTFDALFANREADFTSSVAWESGVNAVTKVSGTDRNDTDIDTGWTLEAAIPRSALAGFTVGSQWTFLVGRYLYTPGNPTPAITLSSAGDTTAYQFRTSEVYNTLAFTGTDPAPLTLGGDPSVNNSDFRVTQFASGLNYPYAMARLSDGSLLVGDSSYFAGHVDNGPYATQLGRLLRYQDVNGDGIADGPPQILYQPQLKSDGTYDINDLGGTITAIRQAGPYFLVANSAGPVATQKDNGFTFGTRITVLKAGATPADPLTLVGNLNFNGYNLTSPKFWLHRTFEIAVRPTAGAPAGSSYDVFFNVGSENNDSATTDPLSVSGLGLVNEPLNSASIYEAVLHVGVGGGAPTFSNLVQIASGLRNAAGMTFDPVTGDLYFEVNGSDGNPGIFATHPLSADELDRIPAASIGGAVDDFGFPNQYYDYKNDKFVPSTWTRELPLVIFKSVDDSVAPAEIAFAPPGFPSGLNHGIYLGFYGIYQPQNNSWANPVQYYNIDTGSHFPIIASDFPGVFNLSGVLSTSDSLFLTDLGTGKLYQIRAVNAPRPPVLTLNGSTSQTFTPGKPLAVAPALTVTDPDLHLITAATVTLQGAADGDAESLAADASGTQITTSYDPTTGTLRLTGADTPAHYQGVLMTVRYNDTARRPTASNRTVVFAVTDTVSASNQTSVTVTVPLVRVPASSEAGDFDGDGKTDPAVFRQSSDLWVINQTTGGKVLKNFGDPSHGDVPAPGDYEGVGKTDLAVFRPSTAQWIIRLSNGSNLIAQFGDPAHGDVPVPGDYEGVGKTDLAVFRPSTAQWIIRMADGSTVIKQFGDPAHGDVPVPGDYEGVGKTDLAVFRPSTAQWIIRLSNGSNLIEQFGDPAHKDMPAPGDYDGDGKTDFAVYRPQTDLFVIQYSSGAPKSYNQLGDPSQGDLPVDAPLASLGQIKPVTAKALRANQSVTTSVRQGMNSVLPPAGGPAPSLALGPAPDTPPAGVPSPRRKANIGWLLALDDLATELRSPFELDRLLDR